MIRVFRPLLTSFSRLGLADATAIIPAVFEIHAAFQRPRMHGDVVDNKRRRVVSVMVMNVNAVAEKRLLVFLGYNCVSLHTIPETLGHLPILEYGPVFAIVGSPHDYGDSTLVATRPIGVVEFCRCNRLITHFHDGGGGVEPFHQELLHVSVISLFPDY